MHEHRPGFTFIEVLIVIAVLAILVGFGAERLGQSRKRQALSAESDKVLNIMRETQNRSLTAQDGLSWGITCQNTKFVRYAFSSTNPLVFSEDILLRQPLTCVSTAPTFQFQKLNGLLMAAQSEMQISFPGAGSKKIVVSPSGTMSLISL